MSEPNGYGYPSPHATHPRVTSPVEEFHYTILTRGVNAPPSAA